MGTQLGGGARRIHRLSALAVKKASSPGMYADGGSLYLLVGSGGSRSWIFRYRQGRRLRDMGLGPLHTVSLAEARDKALACRKLRLDGRDPIDERRATRLRAVLEAAKTMTFQQCAQAYIAAHEAGWKNPKHAAQWPSTLETYAYPVFGKLPVLVIKALGPIWTTKPETAGRVRGRIESILDWAAASGYRRGENPARWRGHLENLLPKKTKVRVVEHHAALSYKELPMFMAGLHSQKGGAARALEFTILTVIRTGAVIPAERAEIKNKAWTVPAARMKGDKGKVEDFDVPSPVTALAIVEQMQAGHGTGFSCSRAVGAAGT
jgi:Phage integrase central domain/Arm DNA-binding domain